MRYALSHPGLPGPMLITEEEKEIVMRAMDANKSHALLAHCIIATGGLTLIPHDQYLASYKRELKVSRRYVCSWGNLHENSDTGEHEACKRDMSRTNPLVSPELLGAATTPPKLALPAPTA